MKVEVNIPGQTSGQEPNQAGSQVPEVTQMTGNAAIPPQTPPLAAGSRSTTSMDPELRSARPLMQEKICDMLLQRYQEPVTVEQMGKLKELAKRLDEALLRLAISKEDYMNLDTLENRLSNLIRSFLY